MRNPTEHNVISTIKELIDVDINIDTNFIDINLDSITFIKIVVALEEKYVFEFDDEKLLITELPTVKTMIEYVESKISSE